MYSLIVMYPQFPCSCPIVQMRDKTSHMGKVIIKQLTYCINASLYMCHRFPFCLPLCLPHSQSFSLAVCVYSAVGMYCDSDALHCMAQHSINIIPVLQLRAQNTLKPRGPQGKVGAAIWTMTSSSLGHTTDNNPSMSELLQKYTFYSKTAGDS